MNINNEPVWVDVDCVGGSGIKYFGRFYVKPYLTIAEQADSQRLSDLYTKGMTEMTLTKELMSFLAILKFHILKTDAQWWTNDGLDLFDREPVYELAAKITERQKPNKPEEPKV